mmetsp:Transcript_26050/g.62753  ORF Transcript_26050/g.62753 Transcript_26050/m.62753 type:complete len:129 (-) Transcript_26050:15-401(-)
MAQVTEVGREDGGGGTDRRGSVGGQEGRGREDRGRGRGQDRMVLVHVIGGLGKVDGGEMLMVRGAGTTHIVFGIHTLMVLLHEVLLDSILTWMARLDITTIGTDLTHQGTETIEAHRETGMIEAHREI